MSFVLADISSAVVTDDTHLTVVLSTTKGAALDATSGFGTGIGNTGIDTLDISAGLAKDIAGNAATTDAVANAALTITTPVAGDAVIDLGASGKLIAPVQVEGKWYYFWDRSGNGTADTADTTTTHDVLDGIFNQNINGVTNTTVANFDGNFGTTETYRYATINGVRLALPTDGLNGADLAVGGCYRPGTVYSFAGAANDATANSNATYDDLLAIWDAKNGTGTGLIYDGTPSAWLGGDHYWSATPSNSGHAVVKLDNGGNFDSFDSNAGYYVALQVL